MSFSARSLLSDAKRLARSDPAASRAKFADVLERFPANPVAAKALGGDPVAVGRALMAMGRAGQASAWLAKAKGGARADRIGLQAVAMLQAGEVAPAARLLEAILDEATASVWCNYGAALRMLGEREKAAVAFRRAIKMQSGYAQAWYNLSTVRGTALGDLKAIEDAMACADRDGTAMLHFAAAATLDRSGEFSGAFHHFASGNALRRSGIGYCIQKDAALFAHLAQQDAQPLNCSPTPCKPVFIVGMPRSGTTLLEQMLARHKDIETGGELTALSDVVMRHNALNAPLDTRLLQAIRSDYFQARPQVETGVLIDKMPLNFRLVGIAAAAMPEAVFLHIRRDPVATCWSNFRHYFTDAGRTNGFAWDLGDLGRFYRLYEGLMRHWLQLLPDQVVTIDYEALTERPADMLEMILARVGVRPDPACLHPEKGTSSIRTASALQVREPIYTGSSQAWRSYEAFLGPLRAALSEPT